jgi:putative DNA primase/helicase
VKKGKPERTFENIPKGYTCTENGVKQIVEDGDPLWITFKPVLVTALSRDESGNNWGVLVWWIDLDEKEHETAIPKKLFHAQGTELAQQLADGGLQIVPSMEKVLLRYLATFNVEEKLIAASCTGWLGEAFVLPNESINEPEGQQIVYQPEGQSNTAKAIGKKGSFKQWKSGMKDASPMIMFFVSASLSAPVRFKIGIEAGGFHAFNLTSQGKTTMLQAASSVWGNGVDPAIAGGDEAYIQRWNSTANALEAKAETFNDLAMVIDEIGEGDPKEFGRTIYRVISGTGRGRANRSGGLRDSKSWRVTILSAGEVAVSDFIESGGSRVKGGQLVRMIDLDLAAIGDLFKSSEEADAMKKLCATHYGHAGPAMLEAIPDLVDGWSDFDHSEIGTAVTAIAKRVRARFALVAYTGVIAVNASILPWNEEQVMGAVKSAYSAWHDRINVVSDIDRGVESVKNFILKHESRFELPIDEHTPRDRAGWFRDDLYHFTDEAFKEACAGGDAKKVRQALKDAGLLHTSTGNKSKIRVRGVTKPVRVTSVKAEILGGSDPTDPIGNNPDGSGGTPVRVI